MIFPPSFILASSDRYFCKHPLYIRYYVKIFYSFIFNCYLDFKYFPLEQLADFWCSFTLYEFYNLILFCTFRAFNLLNSVSRAPIRRSIANSAKQCDSINLWTVLPTHRYVPHYLLLLHDCCHRAIGYRKTEAALLGTKRNSFKLDRPIKIVSWSYFFSYRETKSKSGGELLWKRKSLPCSFAARYSVSRNAEVPRNVENLQSRQLEVMSTMQNWSQLCGS